MKVRSAESAAKVGNLFLAVGGAILLVSVIGLYRTGWAALPGVVFGLVDVAYGIALRRAEPPKIVYPETDDVVARLAPTLDRAELEQELRRVLRPPEPGRTPGTPPS